MSKKFRHIFLKSSLFKRGVERLDAWTQVDILKAKLDVDPTSGDVISGGDGLRKIRMALPGRGKSGGARVIYFQEVGDCVLLLAIYAKNEKGNLNPAELKKAIDLRDEMMAIHKGMKS